MPCGRKKPSRIIEAGKPGGATGSPNKCTKAHERFAERSVANRAGRSRRRVRKRPIGSLKEWPLQHSRTPSENYVALGQDAMPKAATVFGRRPLRKCDVDCGAAQRTVSRVQEGGRGDCPVPDAAARLSVPSAVAREHRGQPQSWRRQAGRPSRRRNRLRHARTRAGA